MIERSTSPVVFQPQVNLGMQRGINQILDAVRPTLGPLPGYVAVDRVRGQAHITPELLDSGGIIARRIIELSDRDEDVGAMFVRNVLCRQFDDHGDGTATAAVLFQAIYNQGIRYISAGGNPMPLRNHLEKGLRIILEELDRYTFPLDQGKEGLSQVAMSICYDSSLAKILGEIFDIIGEYGQLEMRTSRGREHDREYVEGSYWNGGVLSRLMISDHKKLRTQLEDVSILISDLKIEDPHELASFISAVREAGIQSCVIVASSISDKAIGLLIANHEARKEYNVLPVKTPVPATGSAHEALDDLAALSGGRPILTITGDKLSKVKTEDLGRARIAWADQYQFGIVGGRGKPRLLREHIKKLQSVYGNTEDRDVRKKLQERIGKLIGGTAILWVGGVSEHEIKSKKDLAQRTADALRGAVRDGVLPGGGSAFLATRPALKNLLEKSTEIDEIAAYRILLSALEQPICCILANAGYDPSSYMVDFRETKPGFGFDVTTGKVVDMRKAGLLDVASVQKAAVSTAVTSAALALTIDVMIHPKQRKNALIPK